jgi:hypothetical protein
VKLPLFQCGTYVFSDIKNSSGKNKGGVGSTGYFIGLLSLNPEVLQATDLNEEMVEASSNIITIRGDV